MKTFDAIGNMFKEVSNNTLIGKITITGGALLTSYFTPIVGLLVACFACSTVDMLYGIKVAKRQCQKITSRKNWKGTLLKIKDEFSLIMLAHLIEFTVLGDISTTILSGSVAAIIALTELWSILENLNTLNPDGPWRSLSKFLKKKGEGYIGTELNFEHDDEDSSVSTKE